MIPLYFQFVNVQPPPTRVFSFERRHCSVYSDEDVQFTTAEVFNLAAVFKVRLFDFTRNRPPVSVSTPPAAADATNGATGDRPWFRFAYQRDLKSRQSRSSKDFAELFPVISRNRFEPATGDRPRFPGNVSPLSPQWCNGGQTPVEGPRCTGAGSIKDVIKRRTKTARHRSMPRCSMRSKVPCHTAPSVRSRATQG